MNPSGYFHSLINLLYSTVRPFPMFISFPLLVFFFLLELSSEKSVTYDKYLIHWSVFDRIEFSSFSFCFLAFFSPSFLPFLPFTLFPSFFSFNFLVIKSSTFKTREGAVENPIHVPISTSTHINSHFVYIFSHFLLLPKTIEENSRHHVISSVNISLSILKRSDSLLKP